MQRTLSTIELALGEARRVRFRLRRISDGSMMQLNDALSIRLEARFYKEAPLPNYACDQHSGYDDWLAGLVTVVFSPLNCTARVGTYEYNIAVRRADEEPVYPGGRLEVVDRQKVDAYPLPGYGRFMSSDIRAAVTKETVIPGMPIAVNNNDARMATTTVSGVSISYAKAGYVVSYVKTGWIELDNWDDIASTVQLNPLTAYSLFAPGMIADTAGIVVGTSDETGKRLYLG